jgi:hypothetical protein
LQQDESGLQDQEQQQQQSTQTEQLLQAVCRLDPCLEQCLQQVEEAVEQELNARLQQVSKVGVLVFSQ